MQLHEDVNLMRTLGFREIAASPEHAVVEVSFRPEVQQLTGVFHAGTLLALADTAASRCAIHIVAPDGELEAGQFPLTVQVSASLLRNTNQGTVTAEARPVHRGRTMIVMETQVRDDQARLLAIITTTHLVIGR